MSKKFLTPLDMNSNTIAGLPAATAAGQAVPFDQMIGLLNGQSWKKVVRAASVANVVLSGLQTVDDVSLVAEDRFLAKDQATGAQNGIYIVKTGAWVRADDCDSDLEFVNATVSISEGTVNADKRFMCTNNLPIVVGATSIVWIDTGNSSSYSAGTGITIISNVIAIDTAVVSRKASANIGDGSATVFNVTHNLNSDDIVCEVWETGGNKEKVEVDAKKTNNNTVTITFTTAPSAGAYRVTVQG